MKSSLKFLIMCLCLILVVSCSEDDVKINQKENQINQKENQSLIPDNFSIELGEGFLTTTWDLRTYKLEDIMELAISDLYQTEEVDDGIFIGVDFHVQIQDSMLIVQPVSGDFEPTTSEDDSVKCGGQKGDGWKSFAVCHSESCVKKESKDAATKLKANLSIGKCLDIRVRRTTFSARVCGRIVDCG